jgi:KaiC/GvpD/RAD55 family RecA-like ATPase/exonuclease VII small subunit
LSLPQAGNRSVPMFSGSSTRSVTVPSPEDLELAKNDALLQLRIGRSAHYYTVVVSAALVFDALLVLYFQPDVSYLAPTALKNLFFLLMPLGAGLYLSFFALYIKWEVYQLWPWELHFSATVASAILNVVLASVFGLTLIKYGAFAHLNLLPWFYPLALVGVSAPIAALVLTWKGWSQGQWIGFISAILPIPVSLVTLFPSSTPGGSSDALALSLVVSAVFYQTSGSFLHLISSGTRTHERELITSHQSRMFQLADEVRRREEAVHFRENALLKREADAENLELSLLRQKESLAEARTQFEAIETEFNTRAQTLAQQQAEWGKKSTEVNLAERANKDRELSLQLREEEVTRRTPQLSEREQRVIQREGEQTKRDFELTQRQKDVDARYNNLPEIEARLETRKKEVDARMTDLLKKEGELRLREANLPPTGAASPDPMSPMGELTVRETKLAQLKSVLDEQNVLLGRRARVIEESVREFKRREGLQSQREAQLATQEAALKQRELEVATKSDNAQLQQQQYATALQELERRGQMLERTREDLDRRVAALVQGESTTRTREATLAEQQGRLQSLRDELDNRQRDLLERERGLEARESEVSLRAQEVERRSETPGFGTPAADVGGFSPASSSARSGRLFRDRGASTRNLSSGAASPRGAVHAPTPPAAAAIAVAEPSPTPAPADTLAAPAATRYADRAPTGTARLDDLLSGGVPPKGHLMLLGDAFVGKEVVLYAFLAEGLKRGEPIVIVTASRSPDEIAQSIGVVSPQFLEYEQMGMVSWIDASGSGGKASPHRLMAQGPTDQAGILKNLVQVSKDLTTLKTKSFRVGFLGLGAVLANAEQRSGFAFLQNFVGILKPRSALAMYSLEGGAFAEGQLETFLTRMDGAIVFRQDRDKTFLQVKGLGDVQTHDWVEARATNRALIIGSFALERIR